jgi:SAM-dependent methyltransferase
MVQAAKRLIRNIIAYIGIGMDFLEFRRKSVGSQQRFPLRWKDRYLCPKEKSGAEGFDRHYVYHTAWAARILAQMKPALHVDISSSLYFCAQVSAFVPMEHYDYRPLDLKLSNLTSGFADLTGLPFEDRSIQSLSCMHVVEHVGLGRYGDQLNPDGDLMAMEELKRVLKPGGSLLLVVPVGRPRIAFNAHRVYSYRQIITYFSEFELGEFALIPDGPGGVTCHVPEEMVDSQTYGCGCFWFMRK